MGQSHLLRIALLVQKMEQLHEVFSGEREALSSRDPRKLFLPEMSLSNGRKMKHGAGRWC